MYICHVDLIGAVGIGHEQIAPNLQQVRRQRAVETGTSHGDLSRYPRAAQIYIPEARLVLGVGSHELGSHVQIAGLQGAGVQLALKAGASHGDLSRDLRAARNHVLEAGGSHEQHATDLQGFDV
ncbi:MAG: hypothetical protein ACRECP_02670 [Methylocella sp.]